jgi:hypothetical protein
MNDEQNEALWRGRFYISMGLRLGGLVILFLGVAIMFTNLLRPGGWPQVGAIIAIIGAVDSVLLPQLLRRSWNRQDRPADGE